MAQNHPDRGQRGLPGGAPRYSAFALAKKMNKMDTAKAFFMNVFITHLSKMSDVLKDIH